MFTQFYNSLTNIPEGAIIKGFINSFREGSFKILLQNIVLSVFLTFYLVFLFFLGPMIISKLEEKFPRFSPLGYFDFTIYFMDKLGQCKKQN
jgi:hypothetical protein